MKIFEKLFGMRSPSKDAREAAEALKDVMPHLIMPPIKIKVEYRVCEADYISDLENRVAAYLAMGWGLSGGVSAADSSTGSGIHRKYVQAIYREVRQ